MKHIHKLFYGSSQRSGSPEAGQGLLEYALIMALIAMVSIAILSLVGGFAQTEYRILHGTFVCAGQHAAAANEATGGNLMVVDIDGEYTTAGHCVAIGRDDISWDQTNGFAINGGLALGEP